MAKLIYTAITSLDGYIEDEDAELLGRSGPSGLTRGGSAQAARPDGPRRRIHGEPTFVVPGAYEGS